MSALPFPRPANDREYQINLLHQTRRQAEPAVNFAAHDHDAPVFDTSFDNPSMPVPAVRVPRESIVFRTDMITLFRVNEDDLRYSQLPGYEYACEAAWDRLERNLPTGQFHALSNAADHGWMHFTNDELDRARRYFSGPAIFSVV